jgi:carbon monoxide dehydrogenase subunit G
MPRLTVPVAALPVSVAERGMLTAARRRRVSSTHSNVGGRERRMALERVFTVPAGLAAVWDVVCDLEKLVRCLPALSQVTPEGDAITGRLRLRIGSNQITYAGRLTLDSVLRDAHEVTVAASGAEVRGVGKVSASVRIYLQNSAAGTQVTLTVRPSGSGRIVGFDQDAVRDAGDRLLDRFVEALGDRLGGMIPAEEALIPAPVGEHEPAATTPTENDAPDTAEPEPVLASVTSIAGAVAERSAARRGAAVSAVAVLLALVTLWLSHRRRTG